MLKRSEMTLREEELFDIVAIAALKVFLKQGETTLNDDLVSAFTVANTFIQKRRELGN